MEQEWNPLLNNVVLQTIFETMEFNTEDFQNLRLVCRTWRDVSLPIWRRKAWLDISKEKRRTAYIAQLESNSNRMTYHPFQKFVIHSWKHPHIGRRNFWNIVGPKMKHLRISNSTFHSKECFREILFRNTPNLVFLELRGNNFKGRRPKRQSNRLDPDRQHHIKPHLAQNSLKHLHLEMIDILAGDVGVPAQDFPLTWMELVSHFPKIETFVAQRWGTDGDKELAELLQSVEILRRQYRHEYWALTHLNITMLLECYGEFCPELPPCLERVHFPLKTLSLEIGCYTREDEFRKILQLYADSLEKLVVWMEVHGESISLSNFPNGVQLEKLTYLEVQGPNFITDLTFLKQMPNLKFLIHDTSYGDELQGAPLNVLANVDQLDGFVHENLRHLCIRSGISTTVYSGALHGYKSYRGLFTSNEIAAIRSLMPNLTDLRLGLDNEGFQFICANWNTLTDLTIRPFLVDEIGFLGIQEGCKFRLPNITHMKNLKTFSTGKGVDGIQLEFPLTNDCIVDGLLVLNNLQKVEFRHTSEVPISVFSQLESRFPNCEEDMLYQDRIMKDLLDAVQTRRQSRRDSEQTEVTPTFVEDWEEELENRSDIDFERCNN